MPGKHVVLRAVCQLSIEIMKSAARAQEMAEAALNVIATNPSPAAEVEPRWCNPMIQNPASIVQDPKSASRL
jgi:hypothetical protein